MKKMIIETLYPEFSNLFGDRGNAEYLCKKLELAGYETEVRETNLYDTPAFANEEVDFLLIGPCSESAQLLELEELRKYRNALQDRIENGSVTLATGNAFELFGQYIETEDGVKTECLGFFGHYAKQFTRLRFNDNAIGEFEGIRITGFKNLLSHSYGTLDYPFLRMQKGSGMNPESNIEGINKNRFFSTYHTGPILPLNPDFTDYLIRLCDKDYRPVELEFEKAAYDKRIAELSE